MTHELLQYLGIGCLSGGIFGSIGVGAALAVSSLGGAILAPVAGVAAVCALVGLHLELERRCE